MYPSQDGPVTWVSGSKEVLGKRNTNGGDIPKYIWFF
jgi:hypothetical protein